MSKKRLNFDFGIGEPESGYIKVDASAAYAPATGWGFEHADGVSARDRYEGGPLCRDFCIPYEAAFRVDLANGTYVVSFVMGDALHETSTTVKYGMGRVLFRQARAAAGEFARVSAAVKVEDGVLRLAFSGLAPRINALTIAPSEEVFTLYLAGDSTVADQPPEGDPYAGWGQMLPMFFKGDAAVANHAASGRSSRSFILEGRLDALLEEARANDLLLIQFGHNDQKYDETRRTEPFTSYKDHLRIYIERAKEKGMTPILITSAHRRYFESDGTLVDTHGDYLVAVKELAEEEGVRLIDLAAKSKRLYEELGEEASKSLFMWGAPGEFIHFPGGIEDNTHFQASGAIRIAELVAEGLRELRVPQLLVAFR
ncbi:rhamnogalacturonan acetylesterase [Paenibacillus methanolicus]|uniref:Lysophospholipase L1-like esterase n=1 Tax=Paenibacillus methanolicus TaxID=582686 RepID=A0A5S5C640_9BACL|nr:rhamnogalacturonan acetylesterase [Paenibacillus methanolicus]TYP73942.1 lysophospholipase L1-like esterase [Paenibacillus methanolicus]